VAAHRIADLEPPPAAPADQTAQEN
jgi:hypothetical protein